jgi:hypothetical protein
MPKNKLLKILPSQVVGTKLVCPYCIKPKIEPWHECCKETHSELAWALHDGSVWLDSEIELVA